MIKTGWYWHQNKQIDKLNTRMGPEMEPHIYGQLILGKHAKAIQWKKETQMDLEKLAIIMQNVNVIPYLESHM